MIATTVRALSYGEIGGHKRIPRGLFFSETPRRSLTSDLQFEGGNYGFIIALRRERGQAL